MLSNHLILCYPLLLLPSIFPSSRVFSNESVLHTGSPKYWSFSFSISPSSEYTGMISLGLTGLISLQFKGPSRVFSNTTVQKHQFFGTQLSNSHIHTSVQFSCSVVSNSLQSHEPQHTSPPCLPPIPGVHSNLCPVSR